MLSYKKTYFLYILFSFFTNQILFSNNKILKKELGELEQYLNSEIKKTNGNKKSKKSIAKRIKTLSYQISKNTNEKQKTITIVLNNLEKLFIEINNLDTKKRSLTEFQNKLIKIQKELQGIFKNKNDKIYLSKINLVIDTIETVINQNTPDQSFIKKILKSAVLALFAGASITAINLYNNSKKINTKTANMKIDLSNKVDLEIPTKSSDSKESSDYAIITSPSNDKFKISPSDLWQYIREHFFIFRCLEKKGLVEQYALNYKEIADKIPAKRLSNIYKYMLSKDSKYLYNENFEDLPENLVDAINEYVYLISYNL
ncbi:MAG: hypothetical protein ABIF12_01390 [bacterium]